MSHGCLDLLASVVAKVVAKPEKYSSLWHASTVHVGDSQVRWSPAFQLELRAMVSREQATTDNDLNLNKTKQSSIDPSCRCTLAEIQWLAVQEHQNQDPIFHKHQESMQPMLIHDLLLVNSLL